jgi:hypothetical protein
MIDQQQFAICETRGHGILACFDGLWTKCKWCGAWVREVKTVTIETREDEPPVSERSVLTRLNKP